MYYELRYWVALQLHKLLVQVKLRRYVLPRPRRPDVLFLQELPEQLSDLYQLDELYIMHHELLPDTDRRVHAVRVGLGLCGRQLPRHNHLQVPTLHKQLRCLRRQLRLHHLLRWILPLRQHLCRDLSCIYVSNGERYVCAMHHQLHYLQRFANVQPVFRRLLSRLHMASRGQGQVHLRPSMPRRVLQQPAKQLLNVPASMREVHVPYCLHFMHPQQLPRWDDVRDQVRQRSARGH